MEKSQNKHYVLLIVLSIFVIVISANYYKYMKYDNNKLLINYRYNNGETNYTNFTSNFKDKQIIKIKNNSNDVKVLSIKWVNIKNTLSLQDKFLYKISCKGSICNQSDFPYLQVPNSDIVLLQDIYIEMNQEQSFFISFSYNGFGDDKGYFKGKLVVDEEVTDYQKKEEYLKQRKAKKAFIKKAIKENQNMDD